MLWALTACAHPLTSLSHNQPHCSTDTDVAEPTHVQELSGWCASGQQQHHLAAGPTADRPQPLIPHQLSTCWAVECICVCGHRWLLLPEVCEILTQHQLLLLLRQLENTFHCCLQCPNLDKYSDVVTRLVCVALHRPCTAQALARPPPPSSPLPRPTPTAATQHVPPVPHTTRPAADPATLLQPPTACVRPAPPPPSAFAAVQSATCGGASAAATAAASLGARANTLTTTLPGRSCHTLVRARDLDSLRLLILAAQAPSMGHQSPPTLCSNT